MAQLPRGIAPELLVSQVRNTMPYLFEPGAEDAPLGRLPPARVLREHAARPPERLSHFEYFRLCLSAHYLTCATPVPTDVDNQIRLKLWPAQLPVETALQMADLVLECRAWDFMPVSRRFAFGAAGGPWAREALDGHLGEWFTVAAGAYCAFARYAEPEAVGKRRELLDAIADEIRRHSEIFGSLLRANDGLGCLKASASVAHNLGDLDRVMDMWELAPGDPLRLGFYKLGITPFDANRELRYLGRLWVAGELYKSPIDGSSMALENHRHYALRKPKTLRTSPDLLVPIGPFFDDWGRQVARCLGAPDGSPSERTLEVVEALIAGWDRQPGSMGYGRGLRGILELHPELESEAMTRGKGHRKVLETSQEAFELRWSGEALRLMDEIPSRA